MEDILCNNIKVLRFVNTPVPSVTYLLVNENKKRCIVIDPGSKEQNDIRDYMQKNELTLDYILLTHEHFDHCWGVNYLKKYFPQARIVATRLCAEWVLKPWNYFNKLYYNSDEYYQIKHVDLLVEDVGGRINWEDTLVMFIPTPGHTDKGVCITIGGKLFTGDTLLYKTRPYIKKRYGGSLVDLRSSINMIYSMFSPHTKIYPGHGFPFLLEETKSFYIDFFSQRSNEGYQ